MSVAPSSGFASSGYSQLYDHSAAATNGDRGPGLSQFDHSFADVPSEYGSPPPEQSYRNFNGGSRNSRQHSNLRRKQQQRRQEQSGPEVANYDYYYDDTELDKRIADFGDSPAMATERQSSGDLLSMAMKYGPALMSMANGGGGGGGGNAAIGNLLASGLGSMLAGGGGGGGGGGAAGLSSLASLIFGSRPELEEKGDDYRRPLSKRPASQKDKKKKKGSNKRKDTIQRQGADETDGVSDLDLAVGTWAAFGGKYLRRAALWGWDLATQTEPVDEKEDEDVEVDEDVEEEDEEDEEEEESNDDDDDDDEEYYEDEEEEDETTEDEEKSREDDDDQDDEEYEEDMETSESVQIPSFFFSKRKSGVSPLSKLKPQELESLGLKAVGKGADPGDLQDAFAKAQTDGDWTDLEELIRDKLGEEAVEDPDAVVKKDKSKKKKKSDSPLAKLSPEELEELGMEAVDEGVEPTKLQQAYASAQINGAWEDLEELFVEALGEHVVPGYSKKSSKKKSKNKNKKDKKKKKEKEREKDKKKKKRPSYSSSSSGGGALSLFNTLASGASTLFSLFNGGAAAEDRIGVADDDTGGATTYSTASYGPGSALKEKYDYIVSGPEKNSLDPMDQTSLTRFIKVFDLKDEAIVFQNTVNGVLDTVNGFLGDDNSVDVASDKLDSIPAGGGGGGTVSSVPTGLLSTVMKIPEIVRNTAAAAFKFVSPNNALPREGVDSSVVPDAGGFDVANALTLGTLGVGAVGSLVYALYADRAMLRSANRRTGVNRRNGVYAPHQAAAAPEYTYRYRRAASEDRDEGEVTKEETILRGIDTLQRRLGETRCNFEHRWCIESGGGYKTKNQKKIDRVCSARRKKCRTRNGET